MLLIDSASYVVSAVSLAAIHKQEKLEISSSSRPILHDIWNGIRTLFGNTYLRSLAYYSSINNLFNQVIWAVLVLYMARELHLTTINIGLVFAASSAGSLLGSAVSGCLSKYLSFGLVILSSTALFCITPILVPLAHGSLTTDLLFLAISFFLGGIGIAISNVYMISLRQSIIPAQLLGRVNASYRFLVSGASPVGAIAGGLLGTYLGLRLTLYIGSIGMITSMAWILLSPVVHLKTAPPPAM